MTQPVVIATINRSSRFCVDHPMLNSVMHADRWPLPRVSEIPDDMAEISAFTMIDLFQGYWQIGVDETCKEKTASICRYRMFQFEVMPFGFMNSQAKFQRILDRILLKVNNVRCYADFREYRGVRDSPRECISYTSK